MWDIKWNMTGTLRDLKSCMIRNLAWIKWSQPCLRYKLWDRYVRNACRLHVVRQQIVPLDKLQSSHLSDYDFKSCTQLFLNNLFFWKCNRKLHQWRDGSNDSGELYGCLKNSRTMILNHVFIWSKEVRQQIVQKLPGLWWLNPLYSCTTRNRRVRHPFVSSEMNKENLWTMTWNHGWLEISMTENRAWLQIVHDKNLSRIWNRAFILWAGREIM